MFVPTLAVVPLSAASWGALLVAWLAAVSLPGPDVFLLLRLGIRERRAALLAALGIMTGNFLWITASVLGISTLLRTFPALLPILQVVGSLVLVWLGAQSVRAGIRQFREPSRTFDTEVTKRPLWLGLVTNLANPKALIFFTALLSQFIPPGTPWGTGLMIIIVMWVTGMAWFAAVAWASSSRAFRSWFGKATPWFDIVAGGVFILVAAVILIEAVPRFTSLL